MLRQKQRTLNRELVHCKTTDEIFNLTGTISLPENGNIWDDVNLGTALSRLAHVSRARAGTRGNSNSLDVDCDISSSPSASSTSPSRCSTSTIVDDKRFKHLAKAIIHAQPALRGREAVNCLWAFSALRAANFLSAPAPSKLSNDVAEKDKENLLEILLVLLDLKLQ